MKTVVMDEFKMETNIDIILDIMNINNGYITSEMLTDLEIGREYLRILKNKNMIRNLSRGIYIDTSKEEDKYYTFSLGFPSIVLSHRSSLYLYGLCDDKFDGMFDITICKPYHNSKLIKYNSYFVSKDTFNVGLTWVKTPFGNYVKCYDVHRSICDLIRSIYRLDNEFVDVCVKKYLKSKYRNLDILYEYADLLSIKNKVMNYVSFIDKK